MSEKKKMVESHKRGKERKNGQRPRKREEKKIYKAKGLSKEKSTKCLSMPKA